MTPQENTIDRQPLQDEAFRRLDRLFDDYGGRIASLAADDTLDRVIRAKNAEIEGRDAIIERQMRALADQAKTVAAQKKELAARADVLRARSEKLKALKRSHATLATTTKRLKQKATALRARLEKKRDLGYYVNKWLGRLKGKSAAA